MTGNPPHIWELQYSNLGPEAGRLDCALRDLFNPSKKVPGYCLLTRPCYFYTFTTQCSLVVLLCDTVHRCTVYPNLVFPLFAVFVQLSRLHNIRTSTSSSLLVIQHRMFRPNWPTSGP